MKKSILILSSFLMVSTSCIQTSGSNGKKGEDGISFSLNGNEGKGPIKEKTVTENFSRVEVSNAIEAEIFKSTENKVVISAPYDILEYVDASLQSDGTMRIGINNNSSWNTGISTKNIRVKIYTKELTFVEANSSAEITLRDKFSNEKMEVNVSSSGEMMGDLETNNLKMYIGSSGEFEGTIWADVGDISVNSSGDANLKGKIQNAAISVSSSGYLDGKNLEIKNGKLEASSSGSLDVMISVNANADASSSGSINIKKMGNAAITKSESSSGSVSIQ
ncbi:GIN domain-containing protein [Frigoriflavimonas asaccharolytica]|uniref:Cytoskeletal protein CcmA (Bactofilin family) n=1 Tax=Frigoriflavimonas asaccharolytica TaxID=2735899 RepID=A0A8J8K7D6_9FLAO|nr:DUF2807 domain-containing protein [Frigoriflavimonas asaccharolytica]NRS91381.1 cytoskeletal protein CcmA (bactofilin family) [Frigoriflavimonas asaccharolytica]